MGFAKSLAALFGAIILAAGVALSGFFVAEGLITSREPIRIVTVKGLSERAVKANLGFWPIQFTAAGANLEQARIRLEQSEKSVISFLEKHGFEASEIATQNIVVRDKASGYNNDNVEGDFRFILTQDMLITSKNVDKIAIAAQSISQLLKVGVVFSSDAYSSGPSYIFTAISELKGEMLSEATTRAREAAQKFATESQSNVGNIKSANQGVFQILPAVSIPNERADKQIDKKVRVVSTITYFLVD
jgi:hypothetical protein